MNDFHFDLFSQEIRQDPYPHYAELRQRAPVYRLPESGFWVVSRYDDVLFVLKHPELFSSGAMRTMMMGGLGLGMQFGPKGLETPDTAAMQQMLKIASRLPFDVQELLKGRSLIASDPPAHGPMRNIVNRGFTPRRIAALEPRIREIAAEALAGIVEECLEKREFDLVQNLTIPLPVTVIAELLGVESERQRDFKDWSDAIMAGVTGSAAGTQPDWLIDAFTEMMAYLTDAVERRRRDPKDDLISTLVQAEEGETALSPLEVLMFVMLLLVAGNETTTNLIGNAVVALRANPGELDKVRSDPGLVPSLVEEALRYDSPVQALFRQATRDVELAGATIPKGSIVLPLFGAANRDGKQFPDPDRFDVSRNAQGHLAFGFGIHFCLGASLARLEAKVALESILYSMPEFRVTEDRVEYVDSFLLRGPRRLPLAFEQA